MEPTDNFSIRFSGDYTKDRSDPRNGHRLITSLLSGAPVLADVYDTRAGLNTPKQDIEAFGGAMHAELKLSDADHPPQHRRLSRGSHRHPDRLRRPARAGRRRPGHLQQPPILE